MESSEVKGGHTEGPCEEEDALQATSDPGLL